MNKTTDYHRDYRYGKVWREVFARDKKCVLCGTEENLCLDHVLPVRLGGKTVKENLRVLCKSCNTIEGHAGRNLDPKREKARKYMREWSKKHPGYFTRKSREFTQNNPGYHTKDVDGYYKKALTI